MPDYDQQRAELVDVLRRKRILDDKVLEVIGRVPRHEFARPASRRFAYHDTVLPYYDQKDGPDEGLSTISQPLIVAWMTSALELTGIEKVLEVGTGSGYQTAILAELARDVVTIERTDLLRREAEENLRAYDNIHFYTGDGIKGVPDQAPYDRILITAGVGAIPFCYIVQLAEDGILVIPINNGEDEYIRKIRKVGGRLIDEDTFDAAFIPLVGSDE